MENDTKFIKVPVHPKCCKCGKYPGFGEALYVDYDYLGETIYKCEKCFKEDN